MGKRPDEYVYYSQVEDSIKKDNKMEFSRVENGSFTRKQLLQPLTEDEQKFFMGCLIKLEEAKGKIDKQALCVMLIDSLHDNHTEELATITSMMVNKFMDKPFLGDRGMLKKTLETIMGAITMAEEIMGEK